MTALNADQFGIDSQDGWLRVRGPLVFATARTAATDGSAQVKAGMQGFDMEAVSACDSSALAVVVEWLRAGRRAGITVRFRNVPDNLRAIAGTSELGYLFD